MNPDVKEKFEITEASSDKDYMKVEYKKKAQNNYDLTATLDIAKALQDAKAELEKRKASAPDPTKIPDTLNFYGNIKIDTDNEKKKNIRINFNGTIAE